MQAQSTTPRQSIVEMPGPFTGTVPAFIYDRASRDGGYIHADQAHLKKAKDAARAHGWYIADYHWEDEKGDNPERPGYKRVLEEVKAGRIKIVIVDEMARFSRGSGGGWERIQRIEEVERSGARFWRLDKDCFDEPGQARYQEAFQDHEYLRRQAQKALDNLPFAVAAKKLMGVLATGLEREYRVSKDHKTVETVVVHHKLYAPLIRKAAQEYVQGRSVQAIVEELNAGSAPNPHRKDGVWTKKTLYSIFRTPAHAGFITWGKHPQGKHLQYQGPILTESLDCGPVIDEPLWSQLQQRLGPATKGRRMNRQGHPTQLLDGLLVCAVCGERTYVLPRRAKGHLYYSYKCAATHNGVRQCDPATVSVSLADAAVLRQVERLHGQPWSAAAFDAAVRSDPNEPLRVQLRAAMADVEQKMADLAHRVAALQDVGPYFMEAMRTEASKLEMEMQHLKDQYGAMPERTFDPVSAREVWETLSRVDLHQCLVDARAKGDDVVLRDIVSLVVHEARIVERDAEAGHTMWARAAVSWTPRVERLLAHGLLRLEDDPDDVRRPSLKERKREAMRQYRARKREQIGVER